MSTNPKDFLPTTVKEMKALGWDYVDVVLFSGDAYVDHPGFGAAVIGRTLQAAGYKVAIVPQPNWQDDLRDFRKFGKPRLFFGVSPGAMDSMVNHYTANRRRRSDDAYTPDARHGARPDYPSIVYSNILKDIFPDIPVIVGGIEASLRRLSHYDYWQDTLRPSLLCDSKADMIIYGMGEKAIIEIARRLESGDDISCISDIRQTVVRQSLDTIPAISDKDNIILSDWATVSSDRVSQSINFRFIETESNARNGGATLWQAYPEFAIKVNPMYPAMSQGEIDASFDLPYTRVPHPKYKGKRIPAYEMIRHSINLHRGCFGGCAFCTISAHQGKFISSRSKLSIMREVNKVTQMADFKGYISDLGGPSANMYAMEGYDTTLCERCRRPSCLFPKICQNLNTDHSRLLDIYRSVDANPAIKKSFIGSGVRYDLAMHHTGHSVTDKTNREYLSELITNHVSGRLKVAPEHTEDQVLNVMRKPSFNLFHEFKDIFDTINNKNNLNQQLIPYFISSHPGCTEIDMALLACKTKSLNFRLEQVQDFTPTPMTLASEIYYSGVHPYTGKKVYTAISQEEKLAQRMYFFWYDRTYRQPIMNSLKKMHREDLAARLLGINEPNYNPRHALKPTKITYEDRPKRSSIGKPMRYDRNENKKKKN